MIKQTIEKVKKSKRNVKTNSNTKETTNTKENENFLILPHKGKAGETRLYSLRNTLKSVIPANNTCRIIYTGTKLASKFNIKDEISKKYKLDPIYKV